MVFWVVYKCLIIVLNLCLSLFVIFMYMIYSGCLLIVYVINGGGKCAYSMNPLYVPGPMCLIAGTHSVGWYRGEVNVCWYDNCEMYIMLLIIIGYYTGFLWLLVKPYDFTCYFTRTWFNRLILWYLYSALGWILNTQRCHVVLCS